jgi:hypothetical protein
MSTIQVGTKFHGVAVWSDGSNWIVIQVKST